MTTQTPLFSGSIVALVTPMDNHGNIDFETLENGLLPIEIHNFLIDNTLTNAFKTRVFPTRMFSFQNIVIIRRHL